MWVETVKDKITKYKINTIKSTVSEDDGKEYSNVKTVIRSLLRHLILFEDEMANRIIALRLTVTSTTEEKKTTEQKSLEHIC